MPRQASTCPQTSSLISYMTQPLDPKLPSQIQELWASLLSDVVWLHGRWIIYRQLFGINKERVDLLNESAGTFTSIIQRLLLHDIQISISKIGDPAGTSSRANLTLRRLQLEIENIGEAALANSMNSHLLAFETLCKKIRYRRNKWMAHNDLQTRLDEKAAPLTGPSRNEIEQALEAMRTVMHCVEFHYKAQRTAFEHFEMLEDGEHLISALLRGKRYRELVRNGAISHADLRDRFPGGV